MKFRMLSGSRVLRHEQKVMLGKSEFGLRLLPAVLSTRPVAVHDAQGRGECP